MAFSECPNFKVKSPNLTVKHCRIKKSLGKWRLIFLDTYAINVIEFLPEEISGALEYPFKNREKWPEKYRKGHEYLEANNKYCLKALKDQGFMK